MVLTTFDLNDDVTGRRRVATATGDVPVLGDGGVADDTPALLGGDVVVAVDVLDGFGKGSGAMDVAEDHDVGGFAPQQTLELEGVGTTKLASTPAVLEVDVDGVADSAGVFELDTEPARLVCTANMRGVKMMSDDGGRGEVVFADTGVLMVAGDQTQPLTASGFEDTGEVKRLVVEDVVDVVREGSVGFVP